MGSYRRPRHTGERHGDSDLNIPVGQYLQASAIPVEATTLIESIRSSLQRREPSFEAIDGSSPAAVLIPLQYHDDDWNVILNVRSQTVGQHQGEVAFPGGKLEQSDPDMLACALRETWEEMGVRPEDVDVLGRLDAVLTRTNFLVWPAVGTISHPYDFTVDAREVAEVIEIPLRRLLDGEAVRHEARLEESGALIKRVAYAHHQHLVFGATAWILAQLVDVVQQLEAPYLEGLIDKEPT